MLASTGEESVYCSNDVSRLPTCIKYKFNRISDEFTNNMDWHQNMHYINNKLQMCNGASINAPYNKMCTTYINEMDVYLCKKHP